MPASAVRSRNPNHPKKGASIKVEPITRLEDIQRIKMLLADNPRDLCLFTLGINTAYRANELVSIKVGQIAHLQPGDRLDIKQSKNGKYRCSNVNDNVFAAVHDWLAVHPNPVPSAPLFRSYKTREAITAICVTALVKRWCAAIGLKGNYGSHTLRKTWGYHQRKTFDKPLALLTRAFGHTSEWQTLEYLCIQPTELEELYAEAL